VIHLVRAVLFAVIVGALAWLSVGSLVLLNRLRPEKPPLIPARGPDRVAATADNLALADGIAVKHPTRRRPPVAVPGPGWREAELPVADPVDLSDLHTEARRYLAEAAAP
jgi:hypothetical protein